MNKTRRKKLRKTEQNKTKIMCMFFLVDHCFMIFNQICERIENH